MKTYSLGDPYDDYLNQNFPATGATTVKPTFRQSASSLFTKVTNIAKQAKPITDQVKAWIAQGKAVRTSDGGYTITDPAFNYAAEQDAPISTGTKVAIGVAVIGAAVGIGYLVTAGRKKKHLNGPEETIDVAHEVVPAKSMLNGAKKKKKTSFKNSKKKK